MPQKRVTVESKHMSELIPSKHICMACGNEYTVCPPITSGKLSEVCMAEGCDSYDPHCDVEVLFMSDREIRDEKRVVSIDLLRKRKGSV